MMRQNPTFQSGNTKFVPRPPPVPYDENEMLCTQLVVIATHNGTSMAVGLSGTTVHGEA